MHTASDKATAWYIQNTHVYICKAAAMKMCFHRESIHIRCDSVNSSQLSAHLRDCKPAKLKISEGNLGHSIDYGGKAQALLDSHISVLHVCQVVWSDGAAMLALQLQPPQCSRVIDVVYLWVTQASGFCA